MNNTFRSLLALSLLVQGLSPATVLAAGNAPAPKTDMVFRGFQQTAPPVGVFRDAATLPTAITGYTKGTCVPLLVKATNGSKKTGDVNLTFVYPYENGSQIGINDIERISVSGGGDPQAAVNSASQIILSGTSLITSNAAMLDTGASVAMTVNGPYKGDNTGKSPIKNEAGLRHYNLELKAVPSGATAYVVACARISSDTNTIIDPYALITVKQGGQTDGQVYIKKESTPPPPPPPPPPTPGQATLRVTKIVINDSGGIKPASEFSLFIDEVPVTSGVANTVTTGTHIVSEAPDPGYIAAFSGDCDANGNVTLAEGEVKNCILTNNDVPVGLTIVTRVINDDGGSALPSDFTTILQANADDPVLILNGSSTGISINLGTGPYGVGQILHQGYEISFEGNCFGFINAGESLVCTITNNDVPSTLTVITNVINDNTGDMVPSSFGMEVTGDHVSQPFFEGSPDGTTVTLHPGAYSVDESPFVRSTITPHGYTKTLSGDCSGTIQLGQNLTCTVTNDDPS